MKNQITIKEHHLREYLKSAFEKGKNDMYKTAFIEWLEKVISKEKRK